LTPSRCFRRTIRPRLRQHRERARGFLNAARALYGGRVAHHRSGCDQAARAKHRACSSAIRRCPRTKCRVPGPSLHCLPPRLPSFGHKRRSGSVARSLQQGRKESSFNDGILRGVEAILISPSFLFRIERAPAGVVPGSAYRIGDFDLAVAPLFFLWSTMPDDQLLDLAEKRATLRRFCARGQIRRMLADSRSNELIRNFSSQWLYLRNLTHDPPDPAIFRASMTRWRWTFSKKPTSSSNRSFVRIAACWIFWVPITHS